MKNNYGADATANKKHKESAKFRRMFKKVFGTDFDFETGKTDRAFFNKGLAKASDDDLRNFYYAIMESPRLGVVNYSDFRDRFLCYVCTSAAGNLPACITEEICKRMQAARLHWAEILNDTGNLYSTGKFAGVYLSHLVSVELKSKRGHWLKGKTDDTEDDYMVEIEVVIHLEWENEQYKFPPMKVYLGHYTSCAHEEIKNILVEYLRDKNVGNNFVDFFEYEPGSERAPHDYQNAHPMFDTKMQKVIVWLIRQKWFYA